MLKFLLAVTVLMGAQTVSASPYFDSEKPVLCGPTQDMFKALMEQFKEEPTWLGNDAKNQSKYTLFINPSNGTWTLVQYTSDLSCIIGTGSKSKIIPPKSTI